MSNLLPPWPLFSAFLIASLILAVTPGPGVFYIVARSLAQGRRAGLASVAGVALGNLANALLAAWGLAALFALSAMAFLGVKLGGALYLVYLGIRALRGSSAELPHGVTAAGGAGRAFRDGAMVALLNPKTMVFYAAFLPQFMTATAPATLQAMTLGTLFVAIALVTDTAYALAAASVLPLLAGSGRLRAWARRLPGGLLICLGLMAAFTDNRVAGH
jgi:threonine/homoserine/homoserine lactone efflux protein